MFASWMGVFIIAFSAYLLVSTGGLFSEKSGTVNIALDGMMIMGAFTYGIVLTTLDPNGENAGMQYLALLIVPIVGVLFSLLLAIPTVNFMGDHVIVGTALNLIAPAFAMLVLVMGTGQDFVRWSLYDVMEGTDSFSVHFFAFFAIAVVTFIIGYFVLNKTTFGLRLKAAGENPNALAAGGVDVNKMKYAGIMISGALAALGGAIAMPIFANNFLGNVRGMGFMAIAIIIMGQWTMMGILGGTVLFSILMAFTANYGIFFTNESIPKEVIEMLPFILPIVTMMIFKTKQGPNALGEPYSKEQRN